MKKIAIIASAVAGLFLLSCTPGDYGIKPESPIHYDAPEAVTISTDVVVTPVAEIKLADVSEQEVVVAPYTAELPEGQSINYVKLTLKAVDAEKPADHVFELNADGKIAKAELQSMVTEDYGKDLEPRSYKASVVISVVVDGVSAIDSREFEAVLKITPTSEVWGLVGSITGFSWDNDAELKKVCPGVWVSDVIEVTGEFKLRFGRAWDQNRGGTFVAAGQPFAVTNNGSNISVPAGKYQVIFREASNQVILNPASGWGVIGAFAGSSWNWDLFLSADGCSEFFAVAKGEDCQVKLRKDADWGTNLGGTFAGYDKECVESGDNISLKNDADSKVVRLKLVSNKVTVETPAWALIGQVEGSGWDMDYPMYETAPGNWVGIYTIQKEFKLRAHCDWAVNMGGTLAALGTPFAPGGDNIIVPEEGKYMVVFNSTANTITVTKAE